jgi:hypothetical protein
MDGAMKTGRSAGRPVLVCVVGGTLLWRMSSDFDWSMLSRSDCLRVLIFDAELRRVPRPLIVALWEALGALEAFSPRKM